jgi:predicted glycoside hydrolase/deacetylase ChbG (UPF0249 family)
MKLRPISGKLIVTADDYGMSAYVNNAVEECLGAGTVRATCVMVNMPAYRASLTLRERYSETSVGIHWNITQGSPVLPTKGVSTLVSSEHRFYSSLEFKRRWLTGKVKPEELRAELLAQFDRFNELLGVPDFWNTHQNVHVFPDLFGLFVGIGKELGIPAMRCHRRITVPRNLSSTMYSLRHPSYWLKGQMIAWWSSRAERLGTLMPDARVYAPGYREPDGMIREVIDRLPWNKVKTAVEIVIHPATAIEKDLFGGLTESRLLEYHTFKHRGLLDQLQRKGVEPVGFEALRRGTKLPT